MNSKTLFIACGLPGSGKTTYIDTKILPWGAQVVCPDNLRVAMGHAFYVPIEPLIHSLTMLRVRALMTRGVDVVIDECHVRADHIRRWRRLAEEFNYNPVLLKFNVPAEVCKARRTAQNPDFPLEVIDRMNASLQMDEDEIMSMFPRSSIHVIEWDANAKEAKERFN